MAKNPGNVARWVVDRQFQVRGAVATHSDGSSELLIRDNEHSDWRSIVSWNADDVSLQIVAAMKSKGIPYEYLLFPDEGLGFIKPENRLTFYAAVEKFLARYLGGQYEESSTSRDDDPLMVFTGNGGLQLTA